MNIFARPAFIASALVVVALLVGLGYLVATKEPADTGASPEAPAPTTASGDQAQGATEPVAAAGDSDSVCGLTALDNVIPTQALPSTPLEVGQGLHVPSIEGYGPGVTDGISHCYSHNPAGAILAAANFLTWFSSQQQIDETVVALMAEGPNRDRLEAQIKEQWQGQTGSPFKIHGYIYEDRGPDHAMVVLAVSAVSYPDKLVAWPLVLEWQNGDWKVEAPSIDSWGERVIDSLPLEGFIEWIA
ncbi:MAG: hypothetical protein Q4D87_05750 [Actinomycetaceae bacterium]|nr:hypothetical protein [Actinomycetaceae bacterium]